jgi:hypothetical protein
MKHKLVRYRVKPEAAAENRRLVEAVLDALMVQAPERVSYMVVELEDGSFVHLKTDFGDEDFEMGDLPAFQAFRRDIAERCEEPPRASDARIVGHYRMRFE